MKLIEAAKSGDAAKLEALLVAGGRDVESRDVDGRTAAYWAAREGHAECLEMLARAGASLTARNAHGLSPAEAARICGREAALAVLAEREGPWFVEEGGRGRWVAQALAEGQLGCAQVLLEACSKKDGQDGKAREAADAARALSRMADGGEGLDWDGVWRWLDERGGLS